MFRQYILSLSHSVKLMPQASLTLNKSVEICAIDCVNSIALEQVSFYIYTFQKHANFNLFESMSTSISSALCLFNWIRFILARFFFFSHSMLLAIRKIQYFHFYVVKLASKEARKNENKYRININCNGRILNESILLLIFFASFYFLLF